MNLVVCTVGRCVYFVRGGDLQRHRQRGAPQHTDHLGVPHRPVHDIVMRPSADALDLGDRRRGELVDVREHARGDAAVTRRSGVDAMDPDAILQIDRCRSDGLGDHAYLVPPPSQRRCEVAHETSDPSGDVRCVAARHDRELPAGPTIDRLEPRELRRRPADGAEHEAVTLAAELDPAFQRCRAVVAARLPEPSGSRPFASFPRASATRPRRSRVRVAARPPRRTRPARGGTRSTPGS